MGFVLAGAEAQAAIKMVCKVYVSPSCYTKNLKDQGYTAGSYINSPDSNRHLNAASCVEYARDLIPYCMRKSSEGSQVWTKFEVNGKPVIGAAAYAKDGKTYIYDGNDAKIRWTPFHD